MAIDFTAVPARSACSVTSGVVGMASLAASTSVGDRLAVPSKHQVVARERMPIHAPVSTSHRVSSVSHLVEGVLGMSSENEILGTIIELITVPMSDDLALRSGAMKGQGDQVVDLKAPLPSVIPVDGDMGVALVVDLGLQNPAFGARSWNRQDLAAPEGSVVAEPINERTSVIHDHDYTEGAVA